MKIVSWNANGFKSLLKNNFKSIVRDLSADIICLQETKITKETEILELDGYYKYFNYTNKGKST